MNNIVIRKATIDDLKIIQKLNNDLCDLERDNYDPTLVEDWSISERGKKYFSYLINNHCVVVAEIKNDIVGYLAGTINEKGTYEKIQYGEINNMFIKENRRRIGIGKMLIDNFKDYCKLNGVNNIKVVAKYKNKGAIEFYHKNGFEDFDLTLTKKI